ncbi:MAG: ribbon-helix-helix protein, CopG family [Spirochaetes bacterium]|nr:MAG: ribbon-helix-helix protein, CopG family [Spirochaetota bacterium]
MREDIERSVVDSDEDRYTEMALALERGDFERVGEPEYGPRVSIRMGRPTGRSKARGVTPIRSFRLPTELTAELDRRAEAEHVPTSELVRRALAEFLND